MTHLLIRETPALCAFFRRQFRLRQQQQRERRDLAEWQRLATRVRREVHWSAIRRALWRTLRRLIREERS